MPNESFLGISYVYLAAIFAYIKEADIQHTSTDCV